MAETNLDMIRGTTPTILIKVKNDIDLTQIVQIWIYIYQKKQLKVDKTIEDTVIDAANKTITVRLTQEETLSLKAGEAKFQIRALMADTNALATLDTDFDVYEVYKEGVINE